MAKPEEAGPPCFRRYQLDIPGKPHRFTNVTNQSTMPSMSGSTNQKRAAPWAIRSDSLEARNAAMAASRREGLTLGEWLDRAIRQQVKAERSQTQAVGPTIEETLAKLAESMAQQAAATQQQNASMLSRLEAVEQRESSLVRSGGGGVLGRLHGLLWRPLAQPRGDNRQG